MEGATPKERPEDLLASFVHAWSQRDADGLAALFTADADFVNVVGLWWRTRRAIRKAHAYGFERIFARSTLTLEQVAVKELGPDVATIHGRWHMEGQVAPDGSEAEPRDGVLLLVAQRTPDGWLIAAAQNTDRIPGADSILVAQGSSRGASYARPVGRQG